MKRILVAGLCTACVLRLFAAEAPPAEYFRVLPAPATGEAPSITPYLKYQTEMSWHQDEERRKDWAQIRTEEDLLRIQRKLEKELLAMVGGLPSQKTPLNPQITGKIPMNGFHIEKLIFESLPGVYVTAVVYVPENGTKTHPAILVPSGHSKNGKVHYQALCQRLVQRGYVVINWDAVGQGERSQFWDAKTGKSRYNMICAEHAVLGNLAYLVGTSLAMANGFYMLAGGVLWFALVGRPPFEEVTLARLPMYFSWAKAARELGYSPGPVEPALARAVREALERTSLLGAGV